jgi:voltage-gated potassium channel
LRTRARLRDLADRYNAFIARHEIAWELVMAALAAAFVVVGFLIDTAEDSGQDSTLLSILDMTLTVLFVGEFTTRLAAARSRRAYLRGHWIDAVALIPTVRGLRLVRLIRLLRLVRAFAGVFRALSAIERFAAHKSLIALFGAWLAVAVISATAFYLAEFGVNSNVTTPIDALWWAITTLTTVGYGDIFPVSSEGRLAGGALMILGITLWAGITGTITSLLIAGRSADVGIPEQIRQLDSLRQEEIISDEEFQAKKVELLARL